MVELCTKLAVRTSAILQRQKRHNFETSCVEIDHCLFESSKKCNTIDKVKNIFSWCKSRNMLRFDSTTFLWSLAVTVKWEAFSSSVDRLLGGRQMPAIGLYVEARAWNNMSTGLHSYWATFVFHEPGNQNVICVLYKLFSRGFNLVKRKSPLKNKKKMRLMDSKGMRLMDCLI